MATNESNLPVPLPETLTDPPRPPTPSPATPQRVGRYRVERLLGEGGFGRVYLARDEELGRLVAVKTPRRERIALPEDVEAYLTEARTLAGLEHPHIVPVYDAGRTEDGLCFVVSRFIEGSDLAKRIAEARPSAAESAEIVATIAEALHYAHTRGLVHRDVKPANILIDAGGKPYLADFGLALREEDFGKGAGLAGTPAYMSPEQARGEAHRVDGRSDVFCLGVVFYELLTGRLPFQAERAAGVLEQIIAVEARPPRQVDDAIPKELERICLKALAKRATERYTTARDMADDLRHFLGQAAHGQHTAPASIAPHPASDAGGSPAAQAASPLSSDRRPLKIVPKGLRSFDDGDADFFVELLPGPRDRDGLPESIRFWKGRIEETDPDRTFSVGLIYGPSGCGKSSLVKAGLLPRLAGRVLTVYVEATAGETESRLLRGLRKRWPDLPADTGLAETVAALRRGQGVAAGRKLLIVLDQFEQWLHARPQAEQTELVQALRQCDGVHVQCVILVRDDFWMAATRFMRELEIDLAPGRNTAAVDLFDLRHARRVLAAFGRAFGALPEGPAPLSKEQEAFLDQAVRGLSQDGRVVCVRLALFAEMVKGRPWTPAALKEIGGAEGVGVAFLEETFAARTAPPPHRMHQEAARAVLKALLPEQGTDIKGNMRSRDDLLAASGYARRPRDFEELMRILDGEVRLITPTEPEGQDEASGGRQPPDPASHQGADAPRSPARFYQLTHDYLVPSLREWLTRKQKETRRGRAELRLAERAALWGARPEDRRLPSAWEWLSIRLLTRKRDWTPPQRKMMRRAARHHAERGVWLALLLVVLSVVGLAVLIQIANRNRADYLVQQLLDADVGRAPDRIKDLEGYRFWANPRLRDAYAEAEKAGNAGRQLNAALALLPVEAGRADYLYARFLDADPPTAAVILNSLADAGCLTANQGRGVGLLDDAVKRSLDAEKTDEEKERLAKRQANAAVALVRMGRADAVWPLLKHSPDPRVRSYLIHRLSPLGADPGAIVRRLDEETDVSIRRALLLTLGEFRSDQLPAAERERLTPKVLELYRQNPDAGLHGAADWLLRQWGKGDDLKAIDRAWAADRLDQELRTELIRARLGLPKRQGRVEGYWYVNGQGQTMVVVPDAGEPFLMGSPPTEVGRADGKEEQQVEKRIGRSFAIASREVTAGQFLRFRQDYDYNKRVSPTPDCPVNYLTWYDAAAYCNWLTERELSKDQCCYQPNAHGEYADGMSLATDYLKRTGYRLPTEAEWEYACRAGAVTSRYYGETADLLDKYAWYTKNSRDQGLLPATPGAPGGCLKPNDLGLFDMEGNALEWCQDRLVDHEPGEDVEDKILNLTDQDYRLLRGSSFADLAVRVRSADRYRSRSYLRWEEVGFRVARTFR